MDANLSLKPIYRTVNSDSYSVMDVSANISVEWKICRICLESGDLQSVFNSENTHLKYAEKIMNLCTSVEILPDDMLPLKICKECVKNLNSSYTFKLKCEESNFKLRKYIDSKPSQLNNTFDDEFECKPNDIKDEECSNSDIHENLNSPDGMCRSPSPLSEDKIAATLDFPIEYNSDKEDKKDIVIKTEQEICPEPSPKLKVKNEFPKLTTKTKKNTIKKKPKKKGAKSTIKNIQKSKYKSRDKFKYRDFDSFECDNCHKVFKKFICLYKHIKISFKYTCKICKFVCCLKQTLTAHMEMHPVEQICVKTCDHCGKKFLNLKSFRSHLETHRRKSFCCHICGKILQTMHAMREHVSTHNADIVFECKICNKKFKKQCLLNIHLRRHAGDKRYVCDICGKRFFTKEKLNVHKNFHTGEKKYRCKVCGKDFFSPSYLPHHMKTHTGEKPFKCEICHKEFSLDGNLKAHRRTHVENRPIIKCRYCEKSFISIRTHREHEKKCDRNHEHAAAVKYLISSLSNKIKPS